jgi:hypothetical protein
MPPTTTTTTAFKPSPSLPLFKLYLLLVWCVIDFNFSRASNHCLISTRRQVDECRLKLMIKRREEGDGWDGWDGWMGWMGWMDECVFDGWMLER